MQDLYTASGWAVGRGAPINSICPATGETVWSGHAVDDVQARAAVQSARSSFSRWALTPNEERVDILNRYGDALKARRTQIAHAISRDMGKALWESLAEADAMAAKVAISIKAQSERAGHAITEAPFGSLALSHRPHGVMFVVGPYNFPGHLPNGHIVPALLAGNTCVFKPSEQTPQIAAIMVEAFEDAGLPAGCFNLVQGSRKIVPAILEEGVDGVLLTGSVSAGVYFNKYYAERPDVILALEMGGNNPLIVWDAADVEAAGDIAFHSGYLTAGQRCSCARRLILPDTAFGDDVIAAVAKLIQNVKIGAWDEPGIFMGPLASEKAAQDAIDFQAMLLSRGAHQIKPLTRKGAFTTPGLIDVTGAHNVPDEELFGPLLQVIRVADFDEAIAAANNTRFGLAGGLVSDNPGLWQTAQAHMRAGILNLNRPTAGASSAQPFGGPGLSGNHRPGAYYAADYCAWPQASQIAPKALKIPISM